MTDLCDATLAPPPIPPLTAAPPGAAAVLSGALAPPLIDAVPPADALHSTPILPAIGTSTHGPPGPPGVGVREVYVQATVPAQSTTPWLLAQLDGGGDVEFLKVYEP